MLHLLNKENRTTNNYNDEKCYGSQLQCTGVCSTGCTNTCGERCQTLASHA